MENEYKIQQTKKILTLIIKKLIFASFKLPQGGASDRVVKNALEGLDKKCGGLSRARIVDYCVASAYVFKNRKNGDWRFNQIIGPKSIARFSTHSGLRYYEDQWLAKANITRGDLIAMLEDKSEHPMAKYIYVHTEEQTKSRLFNTMAGYMICQSSTLGWSPESESCSKCDFVPKCMKETESKYPELFRLRIEKNAK